MVASHEQVDYEAQNESFIGEWSDDDEEEEVDAEEVGSAPPPQRRVETRSSTVRKQYTETVHVSVRNICLLKPIMPCGSVISPALTFYIKKITD